MEDAIDDMVEDMMDDMDMVEEVAPVRAQVHLMSDALDRLDRLDRLDQPHQPDQTERQAQPMAPTHGGLRSLWAFEFEPAVMLEVEIGQPLPETPGRGWGSALPSRAYAGATAQSANRPA